MWYQKAPIIHGEHAWLMVAKRFSRTSHFACLPETCFMSLFLYSNDE
jgi:hypothetical protein